MEESELRNTAPEFDPKPCPLCGRTMRRGLIQSGGVLYFTDEEKYWINWPLKSRGDIPLLGGKLFPTFPDDGATKLAQICTDCEVVLFYYGKALEQIKTAGKALRAFPAQLVQKSLRAFFAKLTSTGCAVEAIFFAYQVLKK